MRILLTGKTGQVGWELNRSLQPLGEIIALDRRQADLSQPESLREIVHDTRPDVIINAAAYTAVDKAEEEEELATTINGVAPGVLADEAKNLNALFIHYSTDYVFDGEKQGVYDEEDKPNPVNVYGRTKLTGEVTIQDSGCDYLIFRTSWVYASRGKNFLLTILKLAKERDKLSIVSDQIGAPTHARLIADVTSQSLRQAMMERINGTFKSDLYHLISAGTTSWCGFAQAAIDLVHDRSESNIALADICAIPTSAYPTLARRPMNSRLSSAKLEQHFGLFIPEWRRILELCIEDIE